MNARAKELADIGIKEYLAHDPTSSPWGRAVVKAVAVMLAAPARSRKSPDAPKLPFGPQALHQALLTRVPDKVICDAVDGRVFGRLGKSLQSISGLEQADLERLVSWIEAGALSFWKSQPTFEHVVNNVGKWIGVAREWDKRGRQDLHKGASNVGKAGSGQDVEGMFR